MVKVDVLADHLAGRRGFAFVNEVATAKLLGGQSHSLRNFVQVAFEREYTLRGAKPTKCSVGWNICRDRLAADAYVGTEVRSGRVNRSPRQHYRRKGAVSAAIDHEIDLHPEQLSIL